MNLPCIAFLFIIGKTCFGEKDSNKQMQSKFSVFGYLPEYRFSSFDYEGVFKTGLTHLIFFSLEIDPTTYLPSALDRIPSLEDAKKARQAADSVGGKILLSFGGHSRSQGFAEMTKTRKRRDKFLTAVDKILQEYKLDGVDYNWEYPSNPSEWKNWGKLMKESKNDLLDEKSRVVTFTMYLDNRHFQLIQNNNLLSFADFVHCMAYDAQGEHSTLLFASKGIEIAKTMNKAAGFQHQKMTLGMPFYGRNIYNGEAKAYYELFPEISNNRSDTIGEVFYNSQQTLKKKTELALESGIGGVMIWELGQDLQPFENPDSLMQGINAALRKKNEGSPKRNRKGRQEL